MKNYQLIEETLGYVTAESQTNTDARYLVAGSKNVLIDRQRKVSSRNGYTRLGAANTALTPVRNAWTWYTSTGTELPERFYDDELEVYLEDVDGDTIDAWTRVKASWSTTKMLRSAVIFDSTENIDLQIMVNGDDNLYEWNGAVAVVSSITGTTITKKGTATFAQNRFYTTRDKTVVCVRTGTEYTYTGGESTTTLTGIADTTGLVAGDILVQKVVTTADKPVANRNNHTIFAFENQICVGSEEDNEVYISKNNAYSTFTYSSPRVSGEGALLTLDGPSKGFGAFGSVLVAFAGRNSIFRAEYEQITVSTTLAETLSVKKMKTGIDQGAQNPECIIPVGNSLAYLSHEPALRLLDQPESVESPILQTLSNPIKPDFDAEDFTSAFMIWAKNAIYLSAQANSRVYILEYTEDADGKLRRFWQAPQILPVRAMSIINEKIHGHSNVVPETYEIFAENIFSDGEYSGIATADKLPINAIAKFAYRSYGKRANLKDFDEHYTEGEISPSTTDLVLTLNYDFGGFTQQIQKTIDGTDQDILEETLENTSLGQQPLGQQPLGGSINAPDNTAKFRVIFEIAKENFHEMQEVYETNEADRYWSIIARGCNAKLSPRQNTIIKK